MDHPLFQSTSEQIYLSIGRRGHLMVLSGIHEDRPVIFIIIIQERGEGAVHLLGKFAVAGRSRGHGDQATGGCTVLLAAHAAGAAGEAVEGDGPND